MPLDLTHITNQIEQLAEDYDGAAFKEKCKIALTTFNDIQPDQLRAKYLMRRRRKDKAVPWLEAYVPRALVNTFPCPPLPHNFGVAAADGSDIPPDRHSPVYFCVINTGRVYLQYGDNPHAEMHTRAQLYHADELWLLGEEEDMYIEREIEGALLAARRSVEELCALWEMCQNRDVPVVAISDGTLILWPIQNEVRSIRQQLVEPFLNALNQFREAKIPVASYISKTRSQDVVNALRSFVCQATPIRCDACHCLPDLRLLSLALKDVRDGHIFETHLKDGERSEVFRTETPILNDYGSHSIEFFYLKVGSEKLAGKEVGGEVVRVEAPKWVMADEAMLNMVHAALYDQCRRSVVYPRYPPILQEAHEQAVISTTDRRVIEQMVEEALQREGRDSKRGAKDRSKRIRPV